MNQELLSYFYQSIPFIIAVALGFAVPAGVLFSAWLGDKWSDGSKMAVIFGALILGNAVSVALSGRTLFTEAEIAANPALLKDIEQGRAAWGGRISNALMLFVCAGEIARWFLSRRSMSKSSLGLWLAFMAFYISSYWLGVLFATFRELPLAWIYAPIVFTALALMAPGGIKESLPKVRWILFLVLFASLAAAAVVPDMMVERGYKSLIPGFSYRLYGFSEHANSLGAIASLAVILELSPYVRRRPNLLVLGIALVALAFTQSKTAWIQAVVGVCLVRFDYVKETFFSHKGQDFALATWLAVAVTTSLLLVLAMVGFHTGVLGRFFSQSDVVTFTGRTQIWAISWQEFVDRPLFGYGPAIWDLQYRFEKGMISIGQAHNQVFQTLGQAGLFGIVTLFFYVFALGRRSVASWKVTSGLSAIAFFGLLVRCVSESPMRLSGLLGMDAFIHLLAFALAAASVLNSDRVVPQKRGALKVSLGKAQ